MNDDNSGREREGAALQLALSTAAGKAIGMVSADMSRGQPPSQTPLTGGRPELFFFRTFK